MENPFQGWYWGRLFDPKYTMIYGWVIPREEGMPVVSPFMLAKGSEIIVSTDRISVTIEEEKRDDQYGFEMPMRLRIRSQGPGVDLDCLLSTKKVVEALQIPRGDGTFHYYRFLANYEASIEVDGVKEQASGETVHEMMVLE